jgi:hypothetical protein
MAGLTGNNRTDRRGRVNNTKFAAIGANVILESRRAMALSAACWYFGGIIFVPMDEGFRFRIRMSRGSPLFFEGDNNGRFSRHLDYHLYRNLDFHRHFDLNGLTGDFDFNNSRDFNFNFLWL